MICWKYIACIPILLLFLRQTLPVAFAPVTGVSSFRSKPFAALMLGIALPGYVALGWQYGTPSPALNLSSTLVLSITCLIATLIGMRVSRFVSIVYTFMGALAGLQLFEAGHLSWRVLERPLVWVMAVICAALLGFALYHALFRILRPARRNLLHWTSMIRTFMLVLSIFLVLAIVINHGFLLLCFLPHSLPFTGANIAFSCAFWVITILLLPFTYKHLKKIGYIMAAREFDIHPLTAISLLTATVIVLTVTAFLPVRSMMPGCPVSLSSLLFAGLMGAGWAQGKEKLERKTITRKILADTATPLLALLMAYSLCTTVSHNQSGNAAILICSAVLVLIAGALFLEMRHNARTRAALQLHQREQELFENQRALNTLEVQSVLTENQHLYKRLEQKRGELMNVALQIEEQMAFMDSMLEKIREVGRCPEPSRQKEMLAALEGSLSQRRSFTRELDGFYTQVESLHKDFTLKLREKFPSLTPQEQRLATLLRLGFSSKEMARLMNISAKGVEIGRYRLRKKLNLERQDNLIHYIQSI